MSTIDIMSLQVLLAFWCSIFSLLDCVGSSLISVQLVLVSGDGHRIEICISGVIESWALSQYIILSTVEDLV